MEIGRGDILWKLWCQHWLLEVHRCQYSQQQRSHFFVTDIFEEDASNMFMFSRGFHFCAVLCILLSCSSTIQTRPARGNGSSVQQTLQKQNQHQQLAKSALAAVNARIGSRPPSCINKCDSCTPCQAVQASQSLAEMSTNIGSRPPSCQNKCNRCIPCQAVQVPTPIERRVPIPSSSSSSSPSSSSSRTADSASQGQGQVSVEYSNYKPEGWRCKCGNKLFNP